MIDHLRKVLDSKSHDGIPDTSIIRSDPIVRIAFTHVVVDERQEYNMEQFVGVEGSKGSGSHQNSLNPFIGIWIQPRGTIRQIVDTDPGKYNYALAAVAGIQQVLDGMVDNALDEMSFPANTT